MFTLSNYSGNRFKWNEHNPNERWSIQKILKVFNKSIDYLPLTVSKESNDRKIAQGCLKLPNSSYKCLPVFCLWCNI